MQWQMGNMSGLLWLGNTKHLPCFQTVAKTRTGVLVNEK